MGQPAARVSDMHVCPMVTGVVPHVGGPILPPGCPTVLIGGMPAARVGDMLTCVGPPDVIAQGATTVLIGGMPAARMGDMTVHGGSIVIGCPTVLIGDAGGGGGGSSAASSGAQPGPGIIGGVIQYLKDTLNNLFGETYSPGIVIKGDAAFRAKVRARLDTIKATKSGKTTLSQIDASGKTATISEYKGNNSFSGANDPVAATAKGKPVYDGSGQPINGPTGSQAIGTGMGSDTQVQLNPDLTLPNPSDPSKPMPNDAVLFHELTHSAHQTNGNMDCSPTPGWDTAEEQRTISTGDPSEASYLKETGYPYHRIDHGVTFVPN